MNNEYISRQDAIIQLSHNKSRGDDEWMLAVESDMGVIRAIPAADVVPVVRCENCKYCIASRQGKLFCIHGFEQTIISAFVAIDNPIFERELDSFCSYGERKE